MGYDIKTLRFLSSVGSYLRYPELPLTSTEAIANIRSQKIHKAYNAAEGAGLLA